MSATLVFTPIVHGPHDGRPSDGTLRCTVHVGLRLDPGADPALGTLAGWPLILNWPQNAVSAALVSPDGSVSAAVDVPATDPALWQAFFPSTTPVVAYPDPTQPPPLDGNTVWYDAAATASYTRQAVATAGTAVIGLDPNVPAPGLVAPIIVGGGLQSRVVPPPPPPVTAQLGAQLGEFFTAPQAIPVQPPPVSVDDEGVTTAPDFHSLLAQLHGVPGVLTPLRLAFDISAPWPAGVAVPSAIKLAISITVDPSVTIATPFVAVEDLSMTDGFLSPALWTPVEFDVSSAAHNLAQTPGAPAPRNNANRSAGFTLLRLPLNGGSSGIADLQTRSARVAGLGDSPAAPFEHGDFVRGYRVDVLDQARGVWRSLCQVTGSLARGGATLAIAGESAVTPVAATDSGGTIRANDTIARWLGWSLSAAAPGAATPGPSAATTFALALAVTPGTLPPLRFGHTYSFRIRNVDVLGGVWRSATSRTRPEPVQQFHFSGLNQRPLR